MKKEVVESLKGQKDKKDHESKTAERDEKVKNKTEDFDGKKQEKDESGSLKARREELKKRR